jgi:hypothetical protein
MREPEESKSMEEGVSNTAIRSTSATSPRRLQRIAAQTAKQVIPTHPRGQRDMCTRSTATASAS